ncbi:MAG: rhomboid family intramembrane serine protease [Bacteroidaceae bacterium]|nr:rhomboid family intramembrane serine protease [Bacteroidaceae bacterium]
MNKLPSVTKNLLAINVLMFLATIVMERQGTDLAGLLGLHFFEASDFAPYQFVTYMFMHSDFSHLFFNMLALYMFGGLLEKTWGSKRFLIFYFVCGVGAGLLQEAVQYYAYVQEGFADIPFVPTQYGYIPMGDFLNLFFTTVGASGAIYGILLGFAMTFPNEKMFVFLLPFPIKAKFFVIGYAAIELLLGFTNSNDGIAHFAHLGGMLFGLLLILFWRNKHKIGGPYV